MSVSYDFSGKLVLITGSTAGIGYSIAELYAKSGANLILNSRKQENVDKAIKELTDKYVANAKQGDDEKKADDAKKTEQIIYGCAADLSTAEGCNKMIEYVNKIGHLDILINNMGIFYVKDFVELTDEEWTNIFNINVMSAVRLCRAFLPKMLEIDETTKKAKGGNIINVSSEAGVRSMEVFLHYSMTKAALLNISRGLAELTKGVDNVRVNCLVPGPTWTPGVEAYIKGFAKEKGYGDDTQGAVKAYFKDHEPTSIKQKFLDPMEVAHGCLFLSSDAASAIKGCAFKVEGGICKIAF